MNILLTAGMVAVIVPCPTVQWDPSSSPGVTYEVFMDETSLGFVDGVTKSICVSDYYVDHEIYVVAQDASGNRSEPSDTLTLRWRFPMDANKDGLVGFVDFFGTLQKAANESFGKCNDGTIEYVCVP